MIEIAEYVIREDKFHGMYLMDREDMRCALRSDAARFTLNEAIEYVESHKHEEPNLRIEKI